MRDKIDTYKSYYDLEQDSVAVPAKKNEGQVLVKRSGSSIRGFDNIIQIDSDKIIIDNELSSVEVRYNTQAEILTILIRQGVRKNLLDMHISLVQPEGYNLNQLKDNIGRLVYDRLLFVGNQVVFGKPQ